MPVQILWINMTTAVFLGMTLTFEPKEPDLMARPPRDPKQSFLTRDLLRRMVLVGCAMLLGAFGRIPTSSGWNKNPATMKPWPEFFARCIPSREQQGFSDLRSSRASPMLGKTSWGGSERVSFPSTRPLPPLFWAWWMPSARFFSYSRPRKAKGTGITRT